SGVVDRIDWVFSEKILRIVDYKTGKYDEKALKAENALDLFSDSEKGKIVQLLAYKYLLMRELAKTTPSQDPEKRLRLPATFVPNVVAGFYFFRNLNKGFVSYELSDEPKATDAFMAYVENFFSTIVRDILDTSKPFSEEPPTFYHSDFSKSSAAELMQ
ncbi:MAG: PD-(D/E)XK nuclease family protein, partial [Flammeovirgaceae bacterium]|nr:PD-(D/E)XK nuclease family protein [Flammeovirgaceae bacterium]MDW8287689.1 PD-(D/E)XK nuclease family protein [Flammeovirgaceae bacterium]